MSKLGDIKAAANARGKMVEAQQAMKKAKEVAQRIHDERRFKLAYVSGDMVLNWFTHGMGKPLDPGKTFIMGVPENTILMGVDYDTQRGAFVFLLGHTDFEALDQGIMPEALNIKVTDRDA